MGNLFSKCRRNASSAEVGDLLQFGRRSYRSSRTSKRSVRRAEATETAHHFDEQRNGQSNHWKKRETVVEDELEPGPSGYKPQPGPSGYNPQPGPSGYNPQPGPSGYKPQPGPSGYKPQPGPSGYNPQPGPSGYKPQPSNIDSSDPERNEAEVLVDNHQFEVSHAVWDRNNNVPGESGSSARRVENEAAENLEDSLRTRGSGDDILSRLAPDFKLIFIVSRYSRKYEYTY